MKRLLLRAPLLLAAVAAIAGAACTNDPYCFTCETEPGIDATADNQVESGGGKGGTGGTMFLDASGNDGTAASDAGPDGSDACANTQTDPKNCGACGNVCDLLGAFPKCVKGVCVVDTCAPGHYDLNKIDSDGCEYGCTPSNGSVESCDGKDNNCNGTTDEGFDLQNDPKNCGECGNVCDLPNAVNACKPVQGVPTCAVASCTDGFSDSDGLAVDGCEYACPVWPPVAEECNNLDDNCDGQVNENNPGGGQPCESSCPGGVCKGQCTPGATLCSGTTLICEGGQGPTLEVCDAQDNNCDGQVDEGFDVSKDPVNCGVCGKVCVLANAIGGCQNGLCVVTTCLPGYSNLDGDPSNGCEYKYPVNPPTVETCNGLDDDGNGVVDDPAEIAAQKPPQAGCYPKPGTPCAGADFVCTGATGWRCNYGPGAEVGVDGKLLVAENKCDGIDGNCNGQVDESFPDVGTDCDNGLKGACRDLGKHVCDPADDSKTLCDLSAPPDPVPGAPHAETCNGIDDDCNGLVDDGIVDDMVHVTVSGSSFFIDRYEASRPDATASSAGLSEARRCVTAGVLPWSHVAQAVAASACASTGARLCTATEMQTACEGSAANAFPYGATYVPGNCNGLDFDGIPGGADDDVLLPTGGPLTTSCVTSGGLHDLSGNAAEWTSTVTGNTGPPKNLAIFMAKSGSYKTPALGLTCQFTLSRYASNAILPDLGFRCCHD